MSIRQIPVQKRDEVEKINRFLSILTIEMVLIIIYHKKHQVLSNAQT